MLKTIQENLSKTLSKYLKNKREQIRKETQKAILNIVKPKSNTYKRFIEVYPDNYIVSEKKITHPLTWYFRLISYNLFKRLKTITRIVIYFPKTSFFGGLIHYNIFLRYFSKLSFRTSIDDKSVKLNITETKLIPKVFDNLLEKSGKVIGGYSFTKNYNTFTTTENNLNEVYSELIKNNFETYQYYVYGKKKVGVKLRNKKYFRSIKNYRFNFSFKNKYYLNSREISNEIKKNLNMNDIKKITIEMVRKIWKR
jgi:hypothetical protein